MTVPPVVPGAPQDSPEIVLKAVKIMHEDGTTETVYLEDRSKERDLNQKAHSKLVLAYFGLSILVLSLTAIVTFRNLKNGK